MRRYDSPKTGRNLACFSHKKIPMAREDRRWTKQWERSLEGRLGPDRVGPCKPGMRVWIEKTGVGFNQRCHDLIYVFKRSLWLPYKDRSLWSIGRIGRTQKEAISVVQSKNNGGLENNQVGNYRTHEEKRETRIYFEQKGLAYGLIRFE